MFADEKMSDEGIFQLSLLLRRMFLNRISLYVETSLVCSLLRVQYDCVHISSVFWLFIIFTMALVQYLQKIYNRTFTFQ